MPSSHEVIYFDGKGRAEAIRICFSAAGVEFADTRIKFQEWMGLKPKTPLGALPVLKVDGVEHCQSTALLRYAGSLAGWYPASDPLQALVVDEMVESLNELMSKAPQVKGDEDAKKKAREEYQATVMVQYATFLEAAIQRNGGVGFSKDFSVADLVMQGTVEGVESGMWDYIDKQFFDSYPGIKATAKAVTHNEKVMEYYKSKA